MRKLTQWHDGDVKPVHEGVYETQREFKYEKSNYAYWTGSHFSWIRSSIKCAFESRYNGTGLPVCQWRGLAEKP